MQRGKGWGALALATMLAGSLVLGACGDDSDDAASGTDTTAAADAAGGKTEAFCKDLVAAESMEPPPAPEGTSEADAQKLQEQWFKDEFIPAAKKVEAEAPGDLKDKTSQIIDIFEQKGPGAFEDETFSKLNFELNDGAVDECDAQRVEVTAVNYAYQGVPSTIDAGAVGLQLENKGTEMHEMVILRKNADTTESWDDLLALPQDQAEKKVTPMGSAFAPPGGKDLRLVDLVPGDYAVVCFIPVGLTPDKMQSGQEPDGPPHFTRGMKAEFKVA